MPRLTRAFVRAALIACALVPGAVVAPASAAGAGPRVGPWQAIPDPGPGGVQTDGSRFAVTRVGPTAITVTDTATNRDRVLPFPPCRLPDGTPAPDAPRIVIGGGLVAWQCIYPIRPGIWIDDLRTGARSQPPGLPGLWASEQGSADAASFTLTSVGRHWLYLIRWGYHYTDDILVNVRTPQIVKRPADRADRTVAPDAPAGSAALCAGIRRTRGIPDVGERDFLPLHYDAPYAVSAPARPYASGTTGRLLTCRGARAAPTGRQAVQLGGGLLCWMRPRRFVRGEAVAARAFVQQARTGRRASRRAPGRLVAISHTRTRLYIATQPTGAQRSALRHYQARIG